MDKENILESWKEIAAYLRRNIRTCQIWERELGLPIHRLDASPKARVFAYKNELDRWLGEKLDEGQGWQDAGRCPSPTKKKRLFTALVVTVGTLAFVLAAWRMLFKSGLHQPSPGKPSIAVVNFDNQTGDPAYDYLETVIPNLLITGLEQSGCFEVTTWERLRDLLKRSGRSDARFIDAEVGFELCSMEGVDALVTGSYTCAEGLFVTELKVLDVSNKTILGAASARGQGFRSILETQIDDLCRDILRDPELSKGSPRAAGLRIADVTTSNLEAYDAFLRGKEEFLSFDYESAREHFEKATELDASFATAYLYLARTCLALKDSKSGLSSLRKAKNFLTRATDKERLFIEYKSAFRIEKDFKKGIQILEQAATKYPKEKEVHYWLGYSFQPNKLREAVAELKLALQLDPDYAYAWNQLGFTYALLGRHDEAATCIHRYIELSPGEPNPWDTLAWIHFQEGNPKEAIACLGQALQIKADFHLSLELLPYLHAYLENYSETTAWIDRYIDRASSTGLKMQAYYWKGFYCFWLGCLQKSLSYLEKAQDLAEAMGEESSVCDIRWLVTHVCLEMGRYEDALQSLKAWFEKTSALDPANADIYKALLDCMKSLTDLREGKIQSAASRLAGIKAVIHEVGDRPSVYAISHLKRLGQNLEDEVLLSTGSAKEVISRLKKTRPESPIYYHSLAFSIRYNEPFIRDTLGRAYKVSGDLGKAIAEYERLTNPAAKNRDRRLIHPKTHYRLAQLYEERGERSKAAGEYRHFLDLWKEADPGTPEVENAKKRLAYLGGSASSEKR